MPTIDDPVLGAVEVFDPPPARRRFSPADVLRLVVGLILVGIGALVARGAQSTVRGLEEDLLEAFDRLPDAFEAGLVGPAGPAGSPSRPASCNAWASAVRRRPRRWP
jgi:hypothetical protein